MNKKIAIFFAHSLITNIDVAHGEGAPITRALLDNINKLHHMQNALVSLGFSVDILLGPKEAPFVEGVELELVKPQFFTSKFELTQYLARDDLEKLFIWNGYGRAGEFLKSIADAMGLKIIFLEFGIFRQFEHIRFTKNSALAGAELPSEAYMKAIPSKDIGYLINKNRQYVVTQPFQSRAKVLLDRAFQASLEQYDLLVLQTDFDSSLLRYSPFETSLEFLEYLKGLKYDFDTCRIRVHPHSPPSLKLSISDLLGEVVFDDILDPLQSAYFHRRAVGVNSTLLIEAAALGKPVLNFGYFYGSKFNPDAFTKVCPSADDFSKIIYFSQQFSQFSVKNGFTKDSLLYFNDLVTNNEPG